jgi:hypothetical protein
MTHTNNIPSREEIATLARSNGLDLPEPYFSELVEAYGHVYTLLVRMRTNSSTAGDIAHVFDPVRLIGGESR